jgi:hypothetical protein
MFTHVLAVSLCFGVCVRRLQHVGVSEEAVTVSLDLWADWEVVAVEECALAGTVLRADADAARWTWARATHDHPPVTTTTAATRGRGGLPTWRRQQEHGHGGTGAAPPDIVLAPHDLRTFRLTLASRGLDRHAPVS